MGGINDWLKCTTSPSKPVAEPGGLSLILGEQGKPASAYHLEIPGPVTTTGIGLHQGEEDSDASSPFSNNQPPTPNSDIEQSDRFITMQRTSPIDIATPTRNPSSSPSSQGTGGVKPTANFLDVDSRTSAMMSGTTYENSLGGRGRQESFASAKPISMNNPNRNADGRPRRESLAGSLVQGMSWGGVSVGSWIRDEYVHDLVV